jgi:hypothetical protein
MYFKRLFINLKSFKAFNFCFKIQYLSKTFKIERTLFIVLHDEQHHVMLHILNIIILLLYYTIAYTVILIHIKAYMHEQAYSSID